MGYKKRVPALRARRRKERKPGGGGLRREKAERTGTRALSWKIMSVLSQAESRDEDERTRYEITGIKGRVKSRARTGHRRNRNITIGINSVPRSVSLHHLLPGRILSVYHLVFPSFGASLLRRLIADAR